MLGTELVGLSSIAKFYVTTHFSLSRRLRTLPTSSLLGFIAPMPDRAALRNSISSAKKLNTVWRATGVVLPQVERSRDRVSVKAMDGASQQRNDGLRQYQALSAVSLNQLNAPETSSIG